MSGSVRIREGTGRSPGSLATAATTLMAAAVSTIRESPNTRRAYDNVLRRGAELIGAYRALVDVDDDEIGAAITKLWGHAKPTTWNRNRAAVGSWLAWCETKARWSAPSVPGTCEHRRESDDQTQVVDRAVIDRICTRRDISLWERLLWRMLYETASRANAVLALDVEDCDFDNRRVRVTVKGGDTVWIVWGRGTALLLPGLHPGTGR